VELIALGGALDSHKNHANWRANAWATRST
jgi:hypothetical protein